MGGWNRRLWNFAMLQLLLLGAIVSARSDFSPTTPPDPPTSTTPGAFSTSSEEDTEDHTSYSTSQHTTSFVVTESSSSTLNPLDQAVEDILSLNATDEDLDIDYGAYYDPESNDTLHALPSLLHIRSLNQSGLEGMRASLERLLAVVEEELSGAARADTTPSPQPSQPAPFRDFVTFPPDDPAKTQLPHDPIETDTTQFLTTTPSTDSFAATSDGQDTDERPTQSIAGQGRSGGTSATLNETATTMAFSEADLDFTTDSVFAPTNASTRLFVTSTASSSTSSDTSTANSGTGGSGTTTEALGPEVFNLELKRKENGNEGRRIWTHQQRCWKHSQEELVEKLKEEGTYNPDYMAWDVPGVIRRRSRPPQRRVRYRFLDSAAFSAYDRIPPMELEERPAAAVERNLGALERILRELGLAQDCNLRSPDTIARLYNITYGPEPDGPDYAPKDRLRTKRDTPVFGTGERSEYLRWLTEPLNKTQFHFSSRLRDEPFSGGVIGQVHTVPFGCSQRGSEEEGFLRLCGVCQAIRRLPDNFFPPFINEALCDEDKACLYFYDYPHGKCKQKQMNFVVLRNVGSEACELWRRFNLNVRVSCECFVDRMSFFAKYV